MSANNRPFMRPVDVVEPLDVVLVAPFRAFANRATNDHNQHANSLVEMVFGAVPLVDVVDVSAVNELFSIADRVARPFSLKICGEGWIRLERQLGRDVCAWENRGVTLYRASLTKGRSRPFDYIGVRPWSVDQRAERFGRFA